MDGHPADNKAESGNKENHCAKEFPLNVFPLNSIPR